MLHAVECNSAWSLEVALTLCEDPSTWPWQAERNRGVLGSIDGKSPG